MNSIFDLATDVTYTVTQGFTDYGNHAVPSGARLTYVTRGYDSATGCFLLVFKECKLRFQEEANRQLIDNLQDYLSPDHVPSLPSATSNIGNETSGGIDCPNCSAKMTTHAAEIFYRTIPVEVGTCSTCNLMWFDQAKCVSLAPRSVLELFQYLGKNKLKAQTPLPSIFRCPRCTDVLTDNRDLQHGIPFNYWRCPEHHGELFSFSQFLIEKKFVRYPSSEELANLRATVRQISCANCGGPIDLTTDTVCPHCESAIAFIDPDGVAKAVHDLTLQEARSAGH
jgi:Zn-finger nucleic acid-binding protein